jgi:hypothetical protein
MCIAYTFWRANSLMFHYLKNPYYYGICVVLLDIKYMAVCNFFLAMFETFFLCDKYLASFAYADGRDYGVYDLKKTLVLIKYGVGY